MTTTGQLQLPAPWPTINCKSSNQQSTCVWEKKREQTKEGEEEEEKEINSNKQSAFAGPMQCPCQHNATNDTTHLSHLSMALRKAEGVGERMFFNIFDSHLLARQLPLLWLPALQEVVPTINAKRNNPPGAKTKPMRMAHYAGIMQRLSDATTNTIHPSMVWGNYNFKINQQEEMLENFFPIFIMHLPVLQLLATANALLRTRPLWMQPLQTWSLWQLAAANVAAATAGCGTTGENQ